MKRLLLLFFPILILLGAAGCGKPAEMQLVEGVSGLQFYNQFVKGLQSGELRRYTYSFHSWYEFISAETAVIKFRQNDEGKRELLYRTRNPFVLWHYPPYDYFDGTTYYYKYRNDWFIDTYSKYNNVQQSDFLGVRSKFFKDTSLLTDQVFQTDAGYRIQCTMQSKDNRTYYSFVGEADPQQQFRQITVKEYEYDYHSVKYELKTTYEYQYSQVNQAVEVERPRDLTSNNVINSAPTV